MNELAKQCAPSLDDPDALQQRLEQALPRLKYCKHLYIMDQHGVQITANITPTGIDENHRGRNRMSRPYMQSVNSEPFTLSESYISRNSRRPSLTAIQTINDTEGHRIGFLGADFDLRELPHTGHLYKEPDTWRQVKGDPAIRRGLFAQQRIESPMDRVIDNVLPLLEELMIYHGIYHGKLHFSSSRATIWTVEDPFVYRILNIDDLTDPDICLAYRCHPYHERAIVEPDLIAPILSLFRQLRFADENVYLRAGSLNLINGMIGLNFSCDGSHYMRYDEFLLKNIEFWFGASGILAQ
ncbi:hypothetical protein D5085_08580 [Ectothiorhodospiraceae bacterium BW-2]|nr:hypothetical protein D5085_08580 [Ectothiorhodospiraceae bacterium BW-2]